MKAGIDDVQQVIGENKGLSKNEDVLIKVRTVQLFSNALQN